MSEAMKNAISTERQQFLAERRTGIGGSDAPVILGLSAWKTPLQLWMEKTGRIREQADTPMLRRGRKLEAVVVSEYEEETGRETAISPNMLRHVSRPWMIVHVDRFIVTNDRPDGPGVLEAKSANIFRMAEWQDEAPLAAQVQLQHALEVSGLSWGSVAALIGGLEFKYQDIDRHEQTIALLLEQEERFWQQHVQDDDPPEPQAGDARMLGLFYSKVTESIRVLPGEAIQWDLDRMRAKNEIKRLEELVDEADAKLKNAIGSAEVGLMPDRSCSYAWREEKRKPYSVPEWSGRVLRRRK